MRGHLPDWRIEDLKAAARGFGITIRRPGGSHVHLTHPRVREAVSMPARRPIKPAYVRAFVRFGHLVMPPRRRTSERVMLL